MPRLELGQRDAARRTAVALGEQLDGLRVDVADFDDPLRQLERRLERIGETAPIVGLHGEPVDDDRDRVVLPPIELRRRRDFDQLAVDVRADESLPAHVLEQLAKLAFASLHERRADLEPRTRRPREHDVGDLHGALPLHRPAAVGTVRRARARPQQAQIVVDLGDRADGRARVVPRGLLLDRDRGRQPFDRIDVGLLHQPEELPRVRRQRLDVPPLPLGVDRVERERGFPRARQAGHDRQAVARDRHVDVAQVVLPRAAHDQRILCHSPRKLRSEQPGYKPPGVV